MKAVPYSCQLIQRHWLYDLLVDPEQGHVLLCDMLPGNTVMCAVGEGFPGA